MFSSEGNQYLLFILTALLIYNCSESTESYTSSFGLIPLAIGNQWHYQLTTYDSSGVIKSYDNITTSVERDTSIDGIKWYGYSDVPAGIWYTNKWRSGYWIYETLNSGYSSPDTSWLVYKYPTHVGDIYEHFESQIEVINIDEIVLVSAGEFKVIHLVFTYTPPLNYLFDSFEIFIAPGIGIIKTMQIGKNYDGTKFVAFKEELESYSIR